MSVAFLASNTNPRRFRSDPAFIYRCENMTLALRAAGLEATGTHRRRWSGPGAEVVVVHRPRVSFGLWRLLRRLRGFGARLVADFDDLVFDDAYARYSPAVRNASMPLWRIRRRFREHRAAVRWFDHITVSTDALAAHVRRCFPEKPVTVLYNAVHWNWRHAAVPPARPDRRIVSYFPGTRSHDRDFSLIAEPLTRFLRANPAVRLRITGPLDYRLDLPPEQVMRHEKVPFASFAGEFAGVWVNLAPLEQTPFNASKSALKAIEAGFWGIPTVCSPNPDYARLAGAGAVIAAEPADWFAALQRLLDDGEYARVTHDLRARTLGLADVEQQARVFREQVMGRS